MGWMFLDCMFVRHGVFSREVIRNILSGDDQTNVLDECQRWIKNGP